MKNMTLWEKFFREKIKKILTEKNTIIDIGGGLRISKERGNRYDSSRKWMLPLLKNCDYKILDPISKYNPDIVGDIQSLPFVDNSQDAIFCIAILPYIKNPQKACREMYRTLKPGGYCFVYLPFLYYYHPEKGYYKDYWRFTQDSLEFLFEDFSSMETQSIRGAVETWIYLSPLGRYWIFNAIAGFMDKVFGKINSKQVSGYYIFLSK